MTETTPHEVSLSRYFDAPPELVFRAFTDREQLSQWFGPLMFTVPVEHRRCRRTHREGTGG